MGLGLLGSAVAGGLTGVGDAAKAGGEYLARSNLQEEAAAIQAKRDAVLNEYNVSMEQGKQAFQASESGLLRSSNEGIHAADRTSHEGISAADRGSREKIATDADRTHRYVSDQTLKGTMAHVGAQMAQVNVAERQMKILEDNNILDIATKKSLSELRKNFMDEQDPDKKAAIGDAFLTLSGKTVDRYEAVKTKDAMGDEKVTGFQDKHRGKFIPLSGGGATPSEAHVSALKSRSKDQNAIKAFDAQYGQGAAAKIIGNDGPEQLGGPTSAPAKAGDNRAGDAGGGLLGSAPVGGPETSTSPDDRRITDLRAELATLGNTRQSAARRRSIESELKSLGQ